MRSSRDFDALGHNLASTQALLFAEASRQGFGSYYFLRRFAHSPYCGEFDSTSLASSSSTNEGFLEWAEGKIPKKGNVLPSDTMHWVGYLYRYWCYVEDIPLSLLLRNVSLSYLSSVYNAYHSLSPKEAVSRIQESLGLKERQKAILERHKVSYLKMVEENIKAYKKGK